MKDPAEPNVNALVAEAIALPLEQRQAFVDQLRHARSVAVAEVEQLLAAHEAAEAGGFLEGGLFGGLFGSAAEDAVAGTEQFTDDVSTLLGSSTSEQQSEQAVSIGKPNALVADNYELLAELGAGGMGTVYRAFQRSLNRQVALKIISSNLLRSDEQVARFYLEAEAAASLDHPGIVPVYEVGEGNGVHYYAMALVEGGSLAQHVGKGKRLTPRRTAEIIEQAARAVQHAHDRAVIHRDIKPANILLDPRGIHTSPTSVLPKLSVATN